MPAVPPQRQGALARVLTKLRLLPKPPPPPPPPPPESSEPDACACEGYGPLTAKSYRPRPPSPEWEDLPDTSPEVANPVPPYSPPRPAPAAPRARPEFVGPSPAPWTAAAESWGACVREHERESVSARRCRCRAGWRGRTQRNRGPGDRGGGEPRDQDGRALTAADFVVKVRLGAHARVYCLPWRGERTTFGHIKAKFAHDIYKHQGLGPAFLECVDRPPSAVRRPRLPRLRTALYCTACADGRFWVDGHKVPDHDVPAQHGVRARAVIECRVAPQLLRKPLPRYKEVAPLVSYEALYAPQELGDGHSAGHKPGHRAWHSVAHGTGSAARSGRSGPERGRRFASTGTVPEPSHARSPSFTSACASGCSELTASSLRSLASMPSFQREGRQRPGSMHWSTAAEPDTNR